MKVVQKMKFIKENFFKIAFVLLLIFIYHPWFDINKNLSNGDWPYLYRENIIEFSTIPHPPFFWLEPYYQITAKLGVQVLNLSWERTEKIFWFYAFLFISILSSFKFVDFFFKIFGVRKSLDFFTALGIFIFTANTYILMLVGGGQMGISMAYAISPLAFYYVAKILSNSKKSIYRILMFASLTIAFLFMFDPRVFLLFLTLSLFYTGYLLVTKTAKVKNSIYLGIVFLVSIIFNAFWILPNITFYNGVYTRIEKEPLAGFLSFATLSNSISLLHPNWPENLFGKVTFMRSEFILIALLVYISVFFVKGRSVISRNNIIFFILTGLVGAFFAKGVNDPFGFVYEFFSTLPLSSAYRDPTKFYLWIALSYSILIPFSAFKIYDYLKTKISSRISYTFLTLLSFYFLLLLKPVFAGELNGTFISASVPLDYINLKNFIVNEHGVFNTLWVPTTERYGISLRTKSAIPALDFLYPTNFETVASKLKSENARKLIKDGDIRFVIVPYDVRGEIFLTDRKYDKNKYLKMLEKIRKISYLKEVKNNNGKNPFGKIVVFKVNIK